MFQEQTEPRSISIPLFRSGHGYRLNIQSSFGSLNSTCSQGLLEKLGICTLVAHTESMHFQTVKRASSLRANKLEQLCLVRHVLLVGCINVRPNTRAVPLLSKIKLTLKDQEIVITNWLVKFHQEQRADGFCNNACMLA